jgi:regulator of sirC expression with transglutaminase-like and TPR domain
MTTAERFAALVQRPESEIALDEAALVIAAAARPEVDVQAELVRLDALAAACAEPTLDALLDRLFRVEGLRGNSVDYHDPANSYLDQVLTRRVGIPITLSVVTMEVGRRLGVRLEGVGMPGHFLVRHVSTPPVYVDAFEGGRLLDGDDCVDRFHRLYRGVAFDPRYLQPVGPRAILARMLANLKAVFTSRQDHLALARVLELRVAIPGVLQEERVELSQALASAGQFGEAADALERLAEEIPAQGETLVSEATGLRARLN